MTTRSVPLTWRIRLSLPVFSLKTARCVMQYLHPLSSFGGPVRSYWKGTWLRLIHYTSCSCNQDLFALLEHQVDQFEHSQGSDWRLSDAPSDYIEQLSKAVFGVCFEPARARTHHKLSQNRPTDKMAVVDWTQNLDTPYKTLAYWMSNPDEQ